MGQVNQTYTYGDPQAFLDNLLAEESFILLRECYDALTDSEKVYIS